MIISLEKARQWYDHIRHKISKNKKGKIVIFVGMSIDSLCSLRILVELLKSDIIPYEIIVIQNFNELSSQIDQFHSISSNIIGLVMINCVGENDLTSFWFCQESENGIVCLVVDSKRPAFHKNVHESSVIAIINDEKYYLEYCPTEEEMQEVQNVNIDLNEEEPKEKEEKKKKKLKKKQDEENSINEEESVDDIVNSLIEKSEKISDDEEEDPKVAKRRELEIKKEKIELYYSGNYYGNPSSYIFYTIACQLHREDSKTLWYLIVAITNEYLMYHYSDKSYYEIYSFCQKEVLKLFQSKKSHSREENGRYQSTAKDVKSILIESDYKLYLYRHWNLFDSFIYSNYPLSVLSTWNEQGKSEVQRFFAYIGVPLSQAKQKYRYMKPQYRDNFKNKIIQISKTFDLSDLIFHSFLYQFDQNTEMSAADCVHLLSAVLEFPFDEIPDLEIEEDELGGIIENEEEEEEINTDGIPNSNEIDYRKNEEKKKESHKEKTFKKFWLAYSFLSLKKLNMTNSLIDLAIKFQIALVNTAKSVISKKSIASANHFRYSIISSNITEETKYFHYPNNLEKLSLLIMEVFKCMKVKGVENKPFLLALLDVENKTYFVDGNLGCNRDYEEQRNDFGVKFKYVSKKLGIKMKTLFNTEDVVSIQKEDLFAFIQEISLI